MNTVGRRQKQAKGGYKHIHKFARPRYIKRDPDVLKKKQERLIAREKERMQRKRKK